MQGVGEKGFGREVKDLPRDKECNLVICRDLVLSRRDSWKVAQFRDFEQECSTREESSVLVYQAANWGFLPVSLLLVVEELCPT